MQPFSAVSCACACLTIWTARVAEGGGQTTVTLDPKTVKWSVDGKGVAVRGILSPVTEGVLRGGLRIGTDGQGDLVATDEPGGRAVWRLKAEKDRALVPVCLSDDAVFFQTLTRPAKEADEAATIADSRSLRRVSIKTGDETAPYVMPAETAKDELVATVVLDGRMVFAVSLAPAKERHDSYERSLRHARVVAWNEAGGQPVWSKQIEYRGVASPGAWVVSSGRPTYATTDLCLLSAGAGRVFACTGPHDAITAFDQKSGTLVWTQADVWEYRRGFIGPSVWCHFIGRFASDENRHSGDDPSEADRELRSEAERVVRHELGLREGESSKKSPGFQQRVERKVAAIKEERKKQKEDLAARCRIIGGPVFAGKGEAARVFVAVSEADGPWMGYLATCRIYELSAATGEPVAIIHLPRSVAGTDVRVIDDGVIWRCQGGALARLRAGTKAPTVTMGGSGIDGLGQLVWYREIGAGTAGEKPWLQTGVCGEPWIFSDSFLVRPPAGMFVRKMGDVTMHFPVEKLDFGGGKSVRGLLSVACSPALEMPWSNYRTDTDPETKEWLTTTRGTYGAAITRLEQDGDTLVLTVATESGSNIRVMVPAL